MSLPGFWDHRERAQKTVRELKEIREQVEPWEPLEREISELEELVLLAGEDEGIADELSGEVGKLAAQLDGLELGVMLSRPEDSSNAFFSLQAGAGGTESCDWAEMLWRMYGRWFEEKEYSVRVLSMTEGEEAGLKSLLALVSGSRAFGYLKSERGVHRLVRISPFDSNQRRHTSFVSVDVIPEAGEEIAIKIEDKDLRVDTYRSSGAGGQHVNVTDSAVRITHLPTGIVVQCQNERSQYKNRSQAMKVLKSRLYQLELEEKEKEMAEHYEGQKKIEWGSQIRSYVFQPYTMVKDHRTGLTVGDIKRVMDGDIDPFILEYLRTSVGGNR
jgi:peptide chain release factor 2